MMSVPAKSDLRLAPLKQHFDSYIKTSERRGGKRREDVTILLSRSTRIIFVCTVVAVSVK
jgi:hypothetical protein